MPSKKGKIDLIVIVIVVLILAVFGGILFAFSSSTLQKTSEAKILYKVDDIERPRMEINLRKFDFGKVKLGEKKTQEVLIKNSGSRPLELNNFSTSCDCTSVVIKNGQIESPRFSMHTNSSWGISIEPDQSVTAEITYDSAVHPAKGEIERVIYFQSNDPENSDGEINFKAFVEE